MQPELRPIDDLDLFYAGYLFTDTDNFEIELPCPGCGAMIPSWGTCCDECGNEWEAA